MEYAQSALAQQVNTLQQQVARLTASMQDRNNELRYGQPAGLNWLLDNCIFMYKGAITDIPRGFQLCDGTNGTLDLRDKFIVGAGSTYAVGATGGSATLANHVVTQPSAHTGHGAHGDHGTHTSGGDHTHATHTNQGADNDTPDFNALDGAGTHDSQGGHTHDAHSAHTSNGAISAHTGAAVDAHGTNLPPYFALAFIQKVHAP